MAGVSLKGIRGLMRVAGVIAIVLDRRRVIAGLGVGSLLACGGAPAGPAPAPPASPPPPSGPAVDISAVVTSFEELLDLQMRDEPLHVALRDGLAYQIARAVSFNGLAAGQAAGDPGDFCTWDISTGYWTCVQVSVPTPGFSVDIDWEPYVMDPATLQPALPLAPLGFRLTVPREDGTTGSIITLTSVGDPSLFNTTDWNPFQDEVSFSHEWSRPQVGWGYTGRWARQGLDTLDIVVGGSVEVGSPRKDIDFTLTRAETTSGQARTIHLEVRVAGVQQPVIELESLTGTDGSITSGIVRANGQDIATLSGTFLNSGIDLTPGSGLPGSQRAILTTLIDDLAFFEEAAAFRISFGECIRRQDSAGCSALEP